MVMTLVNVLKTEECPTAIEYGVAAPVAVAAIAAINRVAPA
jgi:Flp pilus assembly pilin Flp